MPFSPVVGYLRRKHNEKSRRSVAALGNISSQCQFCVIYGCVSNGDVDHVGGVVMEGQLSVRTVNLHVY